MKKLLLLLTLVCVSVSFARPNAHSNIVFGIPFGGDVGFQAQSLGDDENGTEQFALGAGTYRIGPPTYFVTNQVEGVDVVTTNVNVQTWAGFANSDSSMYPIIMEEAATITFTAALLSTNAPSTDVYLKFERLPHDGSENPPTEPSYTTDSVTITGGTNTYTLPLFAQPGLTFSSWIFYDTAAAQGVESLLYVTNFILSGLEDNDDTPPSPSASSFDELPNATGDSSIRMTATTATDDNSVLYKFECTTDAAFSSEWQPSEIYVATGLNSGTEYTFTVQAKDDSYAENETTVSAPASATTQGADTTPPSPSTTTATLEASATTVKLTASPSTDSSGVWYNFTSSQTASSGWQESNVYVASGLDQDTEYTFTVQARDGAGTPNETVASTYTITTGSETESDLNETLTDLSGSSANDVDRHSLALKGLEVGSAGSDQAITFDSNGSTFAGVGDDNRNVLRTIADDFDTVDFVYEVSVVASGQAENAFVGFGSGRMNPSKYNVPEWDLSSVGGALVEIVAADASYKTIINSNLDGGPTDQEATESTTALNNSISSNTTLRVQISNDATAEEFTIKLDEEYDGTFVADHTIPPIAHTNLWSPLAVPDKNTAYAEDEVVYAPGGQFDTDPAWAEVAGGGAGATYSYTDGYGRIDSTAGSWAIWVAKDGDNEKLPLADYGVEAGDRIVVTMDMKEFSNSGGNTAGIKMESWNASNIGTSGDMKVALTSEWATYTFTYVVAAGATHLKFVPVQHDEISVGYDNIGIIPNPSAVYAPASTCKLYVGGDDGVVFKDMSITVSGGSVVVDPFSISSISSITGGSVITWTAQSDVTYEVQYKTSLVGGTWETTVSSVTGDGAVSATSDVDAASAFFRVIGQ